MTVFVEAKVEKPTQETWRKRISVKKCFILYKTIAVIVGLSALTALIYVIYNKNLRPVYIGVQDTLVQQTVETIETVQNVQNVQIVEAPEYACNSAECIHTASRVLKYVDENKDPCVNFYDFACGNFPEDINVPNINNIESSSLLKYVIQEQLINVIERPIQNDEPHTFQLIKKFYSTCMDEGSIEQEGLTTMKNILKMLGEWPVLQGDSWVEDNFNWKDCDYTLNKLGYHSYLWNFNVIPNFANSKNRIFLDMPSLLIRETSQEYLESYFYYMVDMAVMFGADREVAKSELKESFELEVEWSKLQIDFFSPNDNNTISQLATKYPSIPWLEYINNFLAPDNQVTEDERIISPPTEYITFFQDVISQKPKRIQANYVMWRVIADSVQFLTNDLRRRQTKYKSFEMAYEETRREECLHESKSRLLIASAAIYVNKYFNAKAKQSATQMLSDIRSEYNEILQKVDWIDETTRKYSLETLVSMTSDIGYPEELGNMEIVDEFYKDLKLDTDDYLQSILKINAFKTRILRQRLRQQFDENDWKLHVFAERYDAEYSSFTNNIHLPAGSLQGIFFDVNRPSYMNYASIGMIISGSITYEFSTFQTFFDKNGNLVQEGWSQNKSIVGFNDKTQCFIDQYKEFASERHRELQVADIYRQRQILAANGGIKMAYLAYNKWSERNGLEPKLPGLNYTPQQMFWISAAQTLCSKYPEHGDIVYIPTEWRVFSAMGNSEYFAKDFNCPAGSPMNPSRTCQFW